MAPSYDAGWSVRCRVHFAERRAANLGSDDKPRGFINGCGAPGPRSRDDKGVELINKEGAKGGCDREVEETANGRGSLRRRDCRQAT